jgi:hypothetical protein
LFFLLEEFGIAHFQFGTFVLDGEGEQLQVGESQVPMQICICWKKGLDESNL